MESVGIGAAEAHGRARAMQMGFVAAMDAAGLPGLGRRDLIVSDEVALRGNFLSYRSAFAARQQALLEAAGIVTDVRGDVLRVGFGLYHDPADVADIAARVVAALTSSHAVA
jgi:kynureninase